ncbi:MAG: DNA-protecting protein DprA [Planctomycetes bacterium]|nr:DNA-protecting protein DprA [Planctomycetota bacterium]
MESAATNNLAPPVISATAVHHLRLHLIPDVGPIRFRRLAAYFGSPEAALAASRGELLRVEGIGPRLAERICAARGSDAAEREVERAAQLGIRIFCTEDAEYPQALKHIPDPPICLYVRGRLEAEDGVALAVVGTRRCSHYGREQATRFGELLAQTGFTVVSGLARGIDSAAHRGALAVGGRTIAVLGNGLASVYPPEHHELAVQIAGSGAVVSEFPIDTAPAAENFPPRNRIIVGLTLGVLVVEAGRRSGALITARLANEYDREVFALPGRVDHPELTEGSNGLIRDGTAKLVMCLDDVLCELGEVGAALRGAALSSGSESRRARGQPSSLTGQAAADGGAAGAGGRDYPTRGLQRLEGHERAVYEAIAAGAEDVDALCAVTQLDAGRVSSTLTALQLRGLVQQLPGGRFERRG